MRRREKSARDLHSSRASRELVLPYTLPYALYALPAALPEGWIAPAAVYALRLVGVGGALVWAWGRYAPLSGPRSTVTSAAVGALAGLAALPLWVALVLPLAGHAEEAWTGAALALRVLAVVTVVPLAEELLMRGLVLRGAVLWDRARRAGHARPLERALEQPLAAAEPGAWTLPAIAISSALFAAGHAPHEWPAALVYGAWMAYLWIARGDLVSCVVAHATTNGALALYVCSAGRWELW